jgi:nucleoside-diphosphate kinase
MGNITFTMIKPEAVAANNSGGILKMIEQGGFRIVAMKKVLLSKERAGAFYAVHKARPFYWLII